MNASLKHLRPALALLAFFSLLLGGAYPFAVTLVGKALFPRQAEGSLIVVEGKTVGSELVGQSFNSAGYFRGRPSATAPMPYNAEASAASNLSPGNPALKAAVEARVAALHKAGHDVRTPIPADLVTASASGLDPHISVDAALYQVPRVAKARRMDVDHVRALVEQHTESRTFGFLGEPRVNVLLLNLALEEAKSK